MATRDELKEYFRTGKTPNQEEFWAWIDSFLHKTEDKFTIDKVEGLQSALASIGNISAFAASKVELASEITLYGGNHDMSGYFVEALEDYQCQTIMFISESENVLVLPQPDSFNLTPCPTITLQSYEAVEISMRQTPNYRIWLVSEITKGQ